MTQNQLIAVAAFVLPSATAILIGYLHRKQMRQVELFRQNPSVGVLPPASPPLAFFKRHWPSVLGIGVPAVGMAFIFVRNEPVTTRSVVLICFNFALIVYNLCLGIESRLLDHILKQAKLLFLIVDANAAELKRQKGIKEPTAHPPKTLGP